MIWFNGLLLKDISDELLNKMKEYNIGFDVSLYPPMKDHIHNVVERIKLKGINVNVSDLVENFYKRFTLVSTNNGEREFSNCFQSFCNNLGSITFLMGFDPRSHKCLCRTPSLPEPRRNA